MMMKQTVVKPLKNPFMEYVELQKRMAKEYYPLWDRGWRYFCTYIYAKYSGRDNVLHSVVDRIESDLVPELIKNLEKEQPSEKPVVVASLASSILLDKGMRSPSLSKLLEIYDKRVSEFLNEHNRGVAGFRSSVLSKALASALSVYDELTRSSEIYSKIYELFRLECVKSSSITATTFCIYSLFSLALKNLREHTAPSCSQYLEAVEKLSLESLTEEQLAMLLLAVGLIRRFYREACKNELKALNQLAVEVYNKVQRFLSREVEAHADLSKAFWYRLSLALKLNNLDKVVYVPEEYTAIKKGYLEGLTSNAKTVIESLAEALSEDINVKSTTVGFLLSVVGLIFNSLIQVLHMSTPIAIVTINVVFIAGVALLITSFYKIFRHREDVAKARTAAKQLEELLKKISEKSSA